MQELADIFELVQEQFHERQKKRIMFYVWLSFFALFALLSLMGARDILSCTLPAAAVAGLLALSKGVALYSNSPERTTKRIAQEMEWLFGEDWESSVDTNTYAFALSRLRVRQQKRIVFLIHLLIFIPVSLYLMLASPVVVLVWLVILIRHARNAFPDRDRLKHREREAWDLLQLHLNRLRPDKQKRKEKPKREIRYRLSDDGELVEEEEADTIDWWDEEPNADNNVSS